MSFFSQIDQPNHNTYDTEKKEKKTNLKGKKE